MVMMPVQVHGKLRGTIHVPKGIGQDDAVAAALTDPSIAKFVTSQPRKVVFVPGRLLNIVA
jgi:leucyl-tRNA synthetase